MAPATTVAFSHGALSQRKEIEIPPQIPAHSFEDSHIFQGLSHHMYSLKCLQDCSKAPFLEGCVGRTAKMLKSFVVCPTDILKKGFQEEEWDAALTTGSKKDPSDLKRSCPLTDEPREHNARHSLCLPVEQPICGSSEWQCSPGGSQKPC